MSPDTQPLTACMSDNTLDIGLRLQVAWNAHLSCKISFLRNICSLFFESNLLSFVSWLVCYFTYILMCKVYTLKNNLMQTSLTISLSIIGSWTELNGVCEGCVKVTVDMGSEIWTVLRSLIMTEQSDAWEM